MPMSMTYTVRDSETGQQITFNWSGVSAPTDSDMSEVFAAAKDIQPASLVPGGGAFGGKGASGEWTAAPTDKPLTERAVGFVSNIPESAVRFGKSLVGLA